jgi:hypothetical protein
MRDLVEDSVVALVADAREDWNGALACPARERIVIQPGKVVDRAATTDDDDGIRESTMFPLDRGEPLARGCQDFNGGAVALEARMRVDELADPAGAGCRRQRGSHRGLRLPPVQ